jgi:hypothetical protein
VPEHLRADRLIGRVELAGIGIVMHAFDARR